jgi:hypothetical protein
MQSGYFLHKDGFGRVYFDECKTDAQHMDAKAPPQAERRTCRYYLDRLFFEDLYGRKGRWTISFTFEEEE